MDFSRLDERDLLRFLTQDPSTYGVEFEFKEYLNLIEQAEELFQRIQQVGNILDVPASLIVKDLYLASIYDGPQDIIYTQDEILNFDQEQVTKMGRDLQIKFFGLNFDRKRILRILDFIGLVEHPENMLLSGPIIDRLCSKMKPEDLNQLRQAFELKTLNCFIPVDDRIINQIYGLDDQKLRLFSYIERYGYTEAFDGILRHFNIHTYDDLRELIKLNPEDFKYGVNWLLKNILTESGDLDAIRILLENGADPDGDPDEALDENAVIPLSWGISSENYELIRLLILHKVNIEQSSGNLTPLIEAVQVGSSGAVRILIEARAKIDHQDLNGSTALMIAVTGNYQNIVRILLEAGANPNIQDQDDQTALFIASMEGDLEAAQLLIKFKANLNHQDLINNTALHHAVKENVSEIVRFLIENKADLNLVNVESQTPLIVSILHNAYDSTQILIQAGANLTIGIGDDTPLMLAVKFGYLSPARLLLETRTPNQGINESLFLAGDEEMIRLLLEFEANVNIRNEEGDTLLMIASRENKPETVRVLIGSRAKINKQNLKGETALILAAQYGDSQLVRILIFGGANPNIEDHEGHTPLYYAYQQGKPEVMRLLKLYGGE